MTLTRKQIIDYLYNSEQVIELYRSAIVAGFWPDSPDYQVENLTWYLSVAELNDITKIDELLIDNKETLKRFIEHIYENRVNRWRVTPGFLCSLALIAKYADKFSESLLVENRWDKTSASIVIASANKFSSNLA